MLGTVVGVDLLVGIDLGTSSVKVVATDPEGRLVTQQGLPVLDAGGAEIILDPVMAVWDCGPFPPIFREAGGYFGDW